MRTWGRVNGVWEEVTTDANGFNDAVWMTTLCQVLLLNRGESPFYANYGIPAQQSVVQQVFPDFYVALTQQQFAPYFAALLVAKKSARDVRGFPFPFYQVNVTTHQGSKINRQVPI